MVLIALYRRKLPHFDPFHVYESYWQSIRTLRKIAPLLRHPLSLPPLAVGPQMVIHKRRQYHFLFGIFDSLSLCLRILWKKLGKPNKINHVPIISKKLGLFGNCKALLEQNHHLYLDLSFFLAILWHFFQIILIFKGYNPCESR